MLELNAHKSYLTLGIVTCFDFPCVYVHCQLFQSIKALSLQDSHLSFKMLALQLVGNLLITVITWEDKFYECPADNIKSTTLLLFSYSTRKHATKNNISASIFYSLLLINLLRALNCINGQVSPVIDSLALKISDSVQNPEICIFVVWPSSSSN